MNALPISNKAIRSLSRATIISTCLLGLTPILIAKGTIPQQDPNVKPMQPQVVDGQTKVQIAILLDTSSSMDGLIDQARTQLWKVVNSFNDAEKNGKVPFVEVALYEYGNNGLDMQGNYIRQLEPLTRDLDEVSKELFALKTNGGEEYCGAVISRAVADLKWDDNPKTYKAIFIAGNEAFTQGPINAVTSCEAAVKQNIVVNTIHCGGESAGINGGWKNGALAAGGSFAVINQDKVIAHIESPQDKIILKLNLELNKTYIYYGAGGKINWGNQTKQDGNATGGAAVERSATKSSGNYWNANWDLCDAAKTKGFDWGKLDKKTLPKDLQTKTTKELQAHVAENQKKRNEIKEKMKQANKERAAYVAKVRAEKKADDKDQTLDQAIQNAVKKQAKERGYKFK